MHFPIRRGCEHPVLTTDRPTHYRAGSYSPAEENGNVQYADLSIGMDRPENVRTSPLDRQAQRNSLSVRHAGVRRSPSNKWSASSVLSETRIGAPPGGAVLSAVIRWCVVLSPWSLLRYSAASARLRTMRSRGGILVRYILLCRG